MVRIVSASNLGFGDYGSRLLDREVDGLAHIPDEYDYEVRPVRKRKKVVPVAKKLLSGKLVTKGGTP